MSWMNEHFKNVDKQDLYFAAKCLGKMRLMNEVKVIDNYYNEVELIIKSIRDKNLILEFQNEVLKIMKIKCKERYEECYKNEHF